MLDLRIKQIVNIEIPSNLPNDSPAVIRFSPKRKGIVAVGFRSGRITFADIINHKTCTIAINN